MGVSDLSGTKLLHGAVPAETIVRLVNNIEAEIGITVSIGLSYNKFLAKIASDLDKPRGFAIIDGPTRLIFKPRISRNHMGRGNPCGPAWPAMVS